MMKLLPISAIRAMSVEEQDKLAKLAVGFETGAKKAADSHKGSFSAIGKIVCVVQERLEDLKSDRNPDGTPKKRMIASNTSLASFWGSVTGTKKDGKEPKLNPHWYACAVAFGTYVRSGMIEEADYDKNSGQCLELAAAIANAVSGDLENEAIAQAAHELRERDATKERQNLQDILDAVKSPKEMTAEQMQKLLAKIFAAGFLPQVVASVAAEIAHIKDEELARNVFFGVQLAQDMFLANTVETGATEKGVKVVAQRFSDAVQTGWYEAYQSQKTEAKAPAPKAPKTEPAEIAEVETTDAEVEKQLAAA
jgi:hypothetical protein